MSMGAVLKAIKSRWDSKNLDDTVSGGIHKRRAKNLTAPYVIVSVIASPVSERSSSNGKTGNQYESTQIQLLLVDNGGIESAWTKANAIKAAFDWAPLTVSVDSETLVYCRFAGELDVEDPEDPHNPNAVFWALTYDVLTESSKSLSPS